MQRTVEEYREGFRNHTLAFCLPAAHAEFSNEFLDEFCERILGKDWREFSMSSNSSILALLAGKVCEAEITAEIHEVYGVDVSDLDGLPFWEVVRRCAQSAA